MSAYSRDPIAIVGIGCRYPGRVRDPRSFWSLLAAGVDAIVEIPPDRFDVNALYGGPDPAAGKIRTRRGGFLEGLDRFDAAFFGMAPREAERIDPQQRLLLEVAWEALEDAGQRVDALLGSATGVFVGQWVGDYETRLFADPANVDLYATMGTGRYAASGRISYALGLQGPSLTIDTACSSSLVAVHLACQSLWSGESTLALAGGVNVILEPSITIAYSQSRMLSPDGRCKFGDARADGYVRSEGAGLVVLKPLAQARADGDPIYALIRGSAVNNDGRSGTSFTTPGLESQKQLVRTAYRTAGVAPGDVQYVEAHGTGTRAGDPIEIQALGAVLAEGRPAGRPCALGSVKTNIGHTEGASGIAGLIKVALALKHQTIPASLHVQTLNPAIPWDELPVVMARERMPWPAHSEPATAGVNSFGVSGTNAHVVLQQAPVSPDGPRADGTRAQQVHSTAAVHLLPLSARSPQALVARAANLGDMIASAEAPALSDLCYTASVRRMHHDHRVALTAQSPQELTGKLDAFGRGEITLPQRIDRPRVVFVFPGQGSQWPGMGRQLIQAEPVFRAALTQADHAIRNLTGWSLIDKLESGVSLDEIDVVQPALFGIQVALAELWQSWGIRPDAVVGHSLGEVAAATVAGALSPEDAARVICRRSGLMKRASGRGAMAVAELTFDEALAVVAAYAGRLGVAVHNGPRAVVLSGDADAIDKVVADLHAREVFCRRVQVDVAAHSPHMEPLHAELVAALSGLQPRATTVPLYSTVTGAVIAGERLGPEYWGRNLRQPVRFFEATQNLTADGLNVLVEMSPHPVLLSTIVVEPPAIKVASFKRDAPERAELLQNLGTLYAAGCAVDWASLHPQGGRCVSLPAYPWQGERFWFDTPAPPAARVPVLRGLLGEHWQSSVDAGTHFWEAVLSSTAQPFLADHRIRGAAVLPAAAYVEMALAATSPAAGGAAIELRDVSFDRMLAMDERATGLQLVVQPDRSFQIRSRGQGGASAGGDEWTRHAAGSIAIYEGLPQNAPAEAALTPSSTEIQNHASGLADATENRSGPDAAASGLLGAARAACRVALPAGEHYAAMARRGLDYGPQFQGVHEVWMGERQALGRVAAPAPAGFQIHPALLDGCFQLLVATATSRPDDTYVPTRIARFRLFRRPQAGTVWAHAVQRTATPDQITGDIDLVDEQGLLFQLQGMRLERLSPADTARLDRVLYEITWPPQALAATGAKPAAGWWLVLADTQGVGETLATQLRMGGEKCVLAFAGDDYARVDPERYTLNPSTHDHFQRLLGHVFGADDNLISGGASCRGIVHLWSLDAARPQDTTPAALRQAERLGAVSALGLVQALAVHERQQTPRLWLVTAGVQSVGPGTESVAFSQAPLWGLGGTIAHEYPEYRCTRVDLGATPSEEDVVALAREVVANGAEDQVALRGGARHVARLAPVTLSPELKPVQPAPPFHVQAVRPGVLETITALPQSRREIGTGEVGIAVHATGLNFHDVLVAMGQFADDSGGSPSLGLECAGVVTAVGAAVEHVRPGDAVVAIADDSLATDVVARAELVVPKPAALSFEQAAASAVVFATATYALNRIAHLSAGERVLIHAAAGGVGLAAVQIARRAGAEVFATAGSPAEREYLRTLGIEHVFDSRSLAFADEIMAATKGQGVDVVLNSLAGEFIPKSLALVRPYGRFVEIGRRDIYQNSHLGLYPFRRNLSYTAIDLERMWHERPALVGALMGEVMRAFDTGEYAPLPVRAFPQSQVVDAIQYMAQAKQIGKVVVVPDPATGSAAGLAIRADATYLITGGLGDLGLLTARWLVEHNARHLVLVGRNAPADAARATIAELERAGAAVRVERADIVDAAAVAALVAAIRVQGPPLRGWVHAAGILDDGVLAQQTPDRMHKVMAPKVQGAWNLHQATLDDALDFAVLFSSATAVLGSPGQGNYAAANAFMDALARARRATGRPACSINWGPWAEVGLAAERGDKLALRGLAPLAPGEALGILARLLNSNVTQVSAMQLDLLEWGAHHPAATVSPFFGLLASAPVAVSRASLPAILAAADVSQRRALLETLLRDQAAHVLKLSAARIDVRTALRSLGMDSLMTIEFRNRLEAELDVRLPATLCWNYPTVAEMAPFLADRLQIPLMSQAAGAAKAEPEPARERTLEQLTPEQVEQMLLKELDSINDLLQGPA